MCSYILFILTYNLYTCISSDFRLYYSMGFEVFSQVLFNACINTNIGYKTVEPFYCGHYADPSNCPDFRGSFVQKCHNL